MEEISKQLETCEVEEVKVDMTLKTMKPQLCGWLYNAWLHIANESLIKMGWEKCGLSRPFEDNFQADALKENMLHPLFKDINQGEETVPNQDQAEDIEPCTSIEEVMQEAITQVGITNEEMKTSSHILSLKKMARYVFPARSYHILYEL